MQNVWHTITFSIVCLVLCKALLIPSPQLPKSAFHHLHSTKYNPRTPFRSTIKSPPTCPTKPVASSTSTAHSSTTQLHVVKIFENTSLRYKSLDESTRELLNATAVGGWNWTCFEDAERLMQVLSQRQSRRSAVAAERLLRRVVEEQMSGNPYADGMDMTALYKYLIIAWANSGEFGGPERAEEILDEMQRIFEEGDSYDPLLCGPGRSCFNAIINAYARSGRPDATQQAVRVLAKLHDWYQSGRTVVMPTQETYAAVLRAFAEKNSADAPETVRRLLVHMAQLSNTYPSIKPDHNCHNTYIASIINAVHRGYLAPGQGAQMAEEYMNMMLESPDESVRPDTWTFNMVLNAWSRVKAMDVVDRAENLVKQLELYHKQSGRSLKTRPNSNTYNVLMSCYSRSNIFNKAERTHRLLKKMKKLAGTGINPAARPDTISYNIVMNAYAKSKRRDAPEVVERLLEEMTAAYAESGDRKLRPNSRSVNTCLDALAKSGKPDSAERIKQWINRMHANMNTGRGAITPDKWTYNSYLQALAKCGPPDMSDEAERVLAEMEAFYRKGYSSVKPDVLTFTNVIHCIALSGKDDSVERALAILNRMEDLHAQGYGDVRPNLFTYNCVINSIAKSKKAGKAQLALKLLRRIQSVALKPETVSFNNVINACAFSNHPADDPKTILEIALGLLDEAKKGPGANWITYQTMIRVICGCVRDPQERWNLTFTVFRQCCDDGQLTKTVMAQVRFAVSDSQYKALEREVTDKDTGRLLTQFTVNARRSMQANLTRTVSA